MNSLEADVVILGGGVAGAAVARELSRYEVDITLIEGESDVASGTSKANTGVIHAGYDVNPTTWKGKLNARGNRLYTQIVDELDVPFMRTGSLVVATEESELSKLYRLTEQGKQNGVPGLEIITRERALELEPNLTSKVIAALWAPSAGIVCPYHLVIALAENAVANGVRVMCNTKAVGIAVNGGAVQGVMTNQGFIRASYVINASGLYADEVSSMVGEDFFKITPRRGEYCVLDKRAGRLVNTVVFPIPTNVSKGILVAPTVDGNILIGANAEDIEDKEDTSTTRSGLDLIVKCARKLVPSVPLDEVITQYAGLRATATGGDFIIEPSRKARGFVNVSGIDSPGLSSAPAIAEIVIDVLKDIGLTLRPRRNFNPTRKRIKQFVSLSMVERARLVRENPDYGHIVCRCESVTRAEILEAIRREPGAKTLDAVKRRTSAGMGRCQGGFCGPSVAAILADELGITLDQVTKSGGRSRILLCKTKDLLFDRQMIGEDELDAELSVCSS